MTLEKIKREFIEYMEETRATEPYPRKFFGCLISIIIEHEPISQERMVELTGYSQGTISLTLQKIQLLMPVRTIKKIGDRKHYYTYDGPHERFILDLWQKRVEAQAIDVRLIETMLEKVRKKASRNLAFKRFFQYLKNFQLYLSMVHALRIASIEKFKQVLDTGSFDVLVLQDASALEKGILADFIENLRMISLESNLNDSFQDDTLNEYLLLKNEYFTSIKTNLNPLYSQIVANQFMVIHDIFLEGCTTQERIEKSTPLPRSTISEVLTQSVKSGIIKVTKKEGSRIKLYQPGISFSELMLGNFDRLEGQVSSAMPRLSEFDLLIRKIRPVSNEAKKFLDVLNNLEKAYLFTQEFSKSMKVEMVIKLKEEHDRGFVFI